MPLIVPSAIRTQRRLRRMPSSEKVYPYVGMRPKGSAPSVAKQDKRGLPSGACRTLRDNDGETQNPYPFVESSTRDKQTSSTMPCHRPFAMRGIGPRGHPIVQTSRISTADVSADSPQNVNARLRFHRFFKKQSLISGNACDSLLGKSFVGTIPPRRGKILRLRAPRRVATAAPSRKAYSIVSQRPACIDRPSALQ